MNDVPKKTVLSVIVLPCLLLLCLSLGFVRGCAYQSADERDKERAEQHTKRSESAANAVGAIADGIGGVADKVQSAGRKVDASVTGIGELRADIGRITGTGQDIAASAGRIEERLRGIESILSAAEKNSAVLADGSGDSHPD
ncbi:MAG: hypothetical protein IJS09_04275 [Treponema sp.]|nr:hypothetical protein [Treponema sp.]